MLNLNCTFFGHRDTPEYIKPTLEKAIIDLIINHNVNCFYIGTHGRFDLMVGHTLEKIKSVYPFITCITVLSYFPTQENSFNLKNSEYIFPDVLERTPPKYAIIKRNEWMIEHSDYVITYVEHDFGGAAQFAKKARQKNKTVLNLYDSF